MNSVVLMNSFQVKSDRADTFLTRWKSIAEYMKRQPGFISANLHRGVQNETSWFNYAEWETADAFNKAVQKDEFKKLSENFPGEGSPGLYVLHTKID